MEFPTIFVRDKIVNSTHDSREKQRSRFKIESRKVNLHSWRNRHMLYSEENITLLKSVFLEEE